jgi:hypothetical protein
MDHAPRIAATVPFIAVQTTALLQQGVPRASCRLTTIDSIRARIKELKAIRHVNTHLSSRQLADLAKLEHLKAQYERFQSCGLLEPLPPISIPPGSVDPLFLEAPVSAAGPLQAVSSSPGVREGPGFLEVAMGQRREGPGFLEVEMGQRREGPGFLEVAMGQRREGPGFLEVEMGQRREGPGFLEVAMGQRREVAVMGQRNVAELQPNPTSGDVEMTMQVQAVLPPADDQRGGVRFQAIEPPPVDVARFQAANQPVVDQRNVERFLAAGNTSVVITPRPRRNASAPVVRPDKPGSRDKQAKKKVQVTVRPLLNHPSADKSVRLHILQLPTVAKRFKTPEYLAKEKEAAQAALRRSKPKAPMSTPAMVPQVMIGLFDTII